MDQTGSVASLASFLSSVEIEEPLHSEVGGPDVRRPTELERRPGRFSFARTERVLGTA